MDYRAEINNLRLDINKMMNLEVGANLFAKIYEYGEVAEKASLTFKNYEQKTKGRCLTKAEFIMDLNAGYSLYKDLIGLNEKFFPKN